MCRVEGYVPNAGRHRQRPGPVEKCNTCRGSEKEGSLVVSADVLSAQQNFFVVQVQTGSVFLLGLLKKIQFTTGIF